MEVTSFARGALHFFVIVSILVSCKKGDDQVPQTGTIITTISFEGASSRAPQTTAIPETSWDNIKQVQLFLYDAAGVVRFSEVIKPKQNDSKFMWSMVPTGTYTIAVVANAKSGSDAVTTSLVAAGTPASEWTAMNVRSLDVNNLGIYHKQLTGGFPASLGTILNANSAWQEPAEVFMAYAGPVTVASGQTTDLTSSPLKLRREVSLMRVRVRTKDGQGNDNDDVNFAHDNALLLVYTLPDKMRIARGTGGGVAATSNNTRVMVAGSGASTFLTVNPTSGYSTTNILNNGFTLWRDVVVFPNDGGRANEATDVEADASRKYFIVLAGHAAVGHVLEDLSTVTAPGGAPVYWSGLIEKAFVPNAIREVNLTLLSGGSPVVPVTPAQEGKLHIDFSAPESWSSNITAADMDL
ncbi:MAG: FimB/Mfa2 family fimbrial subunit [Odoribacteraceae bacterium]|jgi:hypothetical protein|nr:FimB/Mfa2 family fimbrial subunit [Odoribacteraceae bacterium]